MNATIWSLSAIVAVAAVTFLLGYVGSRKANTTPDFLVARRAIPATRNAAAISGEYLSAASFLGVAGLVLKDGVDALWYPIGFTAGYLALSCSSPHRCGAPARTRCRTSPRPGWGR